MDTFKKLKFFIQTIMVVFLVGLLAVGLHIKVMMISLKNISKKNHPIFFSTNT